MQLQIQLCRQIASGQWRARRVRRCTLFRSPPRNTERRYRGGGLRQRFGITLLALLSQALQRLQRIVSRESINHKDRESTELPLNATHIARISEKHVVFRGEISVSRSRP